MFFQKTRQRHQEAFYHIHAEGYLHVQECDAGFDYTLYDLSFEQVDGGQLDDCRLSLEAARDKILALQGIGTASIDEMDVQQWIEVCRDLNAQKTTLLRKNKADEIQRSPAPWGNQLTKLFSSSDAQLRSDAKWSVQQAENGGWEIVTSYCSLGGCDLTVIPVSSEREGLLFGALLSTTDFKAQSNTACSSCYSDYMQGCI